MLSLKAYCLPMTRLKTYEKHNSVRIHYTFEFSMYCNQNLVFFILFIILDGNSMFFRRPLDKISKYSQKEG